MICGTCRSNNMLETMKNSEEVLKKLWLLKLPSYQSFKYQQSKSKRASHFSNPPAMQDQIKGGRRVGETLAFHECRQRYPEPLTFAQSLCQLSVGGWWLFRSWRSSSHHHRERTLCWSKLHTFGQ